MKLHLALLCLVPLVAGAITTTLEYEDTREAASRSAVSNEIATAVAPLASTNQLASATNAVAVALRDEIASRATTNDLNSAVSTLRGEIANIPPETEVTWSVATPWELPSDVLPLTIEDDNGNVVYRNDSPDLFMIEYPDEPPPTEIACGIAPNAPLLWFTLRGGYYTKKETTQTVKMNGRAVEPGVYPSLVMSPTVRVREVQVALPSDMAELSSAIRTNYYTKGEVDAAVENAQPGDYANVSNKATTAIQLANIAPNFATPREYKPGDLVIKDGELCVCIQAGAGEYAVFMSAQVCDGIAQLRESLAAVALSGAYSDISGAPTNVSAFTNDAGYLTSFTEMDPTISSWAKAANKPSYTAAEVGALGTSGEQTIAGTGSQEITFSFGSAVPRFTLVDSYGNTTHVEADDSSVLRSPIWLKLPATDGTVALTSDIPASMAWGAITGKPTTISGYGITDALKSDFTSLTNNAAFTSAVAAVSPPTDLTHVEAEIETNRTAIATLSARAYIEVVSADEVYYVFMTNQE